MDRKLIVLKAYERSVDDKGLFIQFFSDDTCHIGDIFALTVDGKERYFKATVIKAEHEMLDVVAKECGYYSKLFKNIDIRNLLLEKVTKVTDVETLARITKESCYI